MDNILRATDGKYRENGRESMIQHRSSARNLFAAIFVAVVPSCGPAFHRLYTGPSRPLDQVAILWCGSTDVRLREIDGRPGPNRLGYGAGWDASFRIELEPGLHVLRVWYAGGGIGEPWYTSNSDRFLTVRADAGHSYTIRVSRAGLSWDAEVVEANAQ